MKVLVIDPWGVKTVSPYTNGFCGGLSRHCDLTLITNYYYKKETDADYYIKYLFFKKTENMKNSFLRKALRGLEYLAAYRRIIKFLKRESFDVIEIEWLLMYKFDYSLIKKLKKFAPVVYKAHNVIPHEHGEKQIKALAKVYRTVDYIVLHGESLKEEFSKLFPKIDASKIIVQHFGTFSLKTSFDKKLVRDEIIDKVESFSRRYILFGGLFYNKGVDRLINIWKDSFNNSGSLLIVAGKSSTDYADFHSLQGITKNLNNLLIIDEFINDNTLNYLVESSNVVLIPYRHASMSGVLFTSAAFSKPVLCTKTGCLGEYFVNGYHGFLVPNSEEGISNGIMVLESFSLTTLQEMGMRFNSYVNKEYSWDSIGKQLISDFIKRLKNEGALQ